MACELSACLWMKICESIRHAIIATATNTSHMGPRRRRATEQTDQREGGVGDGPGREARRDKNEQIKNSKKKFNDQILLRNNKILV
jgi:hypothetical protein